MPARAGMNTHSAFTLLMFEQTSSWFLAFFPHLYNLFLSDDNSSLPHAKDCEVLSYNRVGRESYKYFGHDRMN